MNFNNEIQKLPQVLTKQEIMQLISVMEKKRLELIIDYVKYLVKKLESTNKADCVIDIEQNNGVYLPKSNIEISNLFGWLARWGEVSKTLLSMPRGIDAIFDQNRFQGRSQAVGQGRGCPLLDPHRPADP